MARVVHLHSQSNINKLSYINPSAFQSGDCLLTSLETSTKGLKVCSHCVGFHLTLSLSTPSLSLFFCPLEVILGQAEVEVLAYLIFVMVMMTSKQLLRLVNTG